MVKLLYVGPGDQGTIRTGENLREEGVEYNEKISNPEIQKGI
jgi:hypothetical protein